MRQESRQCNLLGRLHTDHKECRRPAVGEYLPFPRKEKEIRKREESKKRRDQRGCEGPDGTGYQKDSDLALSGNGSH